MRARQDQQRIGEAHGLGPDLQQVGRTCVRWRGRKFIYFGGCDYFRLSSDPKIHGALRDGLRKYGLNVAASRLTTGNHALYETLERAIAAFFGSESARVCSSGYVTNLAAAQALAGHFDCVFVDELSHASAKDALGFLQARVATFKHRDAADLRRKLARKSGRSTGRTPLVVTDGLFSHSGEIAPLREYLECLPKAGLILVDDAHGAGVLGQTGQGTVEYAGVDRQRVLQTITLSKAFGVYGGGIVGDERWIQLISGRSRIFGGNTPLPLPLAAAAHRAVRLVKSDPGLRRRLNQNTHYVKAELRANGFIVPDTPSPVFGLAPRDARHARNLEGQLFEAGIYPTYIRYPSGPGIERYFRFAWSSEHTKGELAGLVRALCVGNS